MNAIKIMYFSDGIVLMTLETRPTQNHKNTCTK